MATNTELVDSGISSIIKAANITKDAAKIAKRNSIMKMADPGMYQYPIMMSGAIEPDIQVSISKAFQQTYASAVVTAYSLNPVMYMDKYREPNEFVRKFHTNDSVPSNFTAAGKVLGATESATEINFEDIESSELVSATINTNYPKEALESINNHAWDNVMESLDATSLNDMYRPYDRTYHILNTKLQKMKAAQEGARLDAVGAAIGTAAGHVEDVENAINGDNDKPVRGLQRTTVERRSVNGVVANRQLEALEPTMVNVQIVCHGKNGQFTQNLTLGVKAMTRSVQSDLMIATMIEACKTANPIFKFMQWTSGEKKTADFILGISAAKRKALQKNAKMEVRVLKQAMKRKKANGIGKWFNNSIFPTLTIIMTTYEVLQVKEACGVDLDQLQNAMKLMNKYYLLTFGIYDPAQNTLKTLFDCDDDWSYTTIGAMRSMMNKTTDMLNQNEILRIVGRR